MRRAAAIDIEQVASRGPARTSITVPAIPALRLAAANCVPREQTSSALANTLNEAVAAEVPRRDNALLVRSDGVHAGEPLPIGMDPITIGRHPSNHLKIHDDGISRCHARIYFEQDRHFIEDLGSRNGTFVEGKKGDRHELHDGDVVQLGPRTSFRYVRTDELQANLLRQLWESSTRDALTGCCNRRHFEERLRTELSYARRRDAHLTLILFDIDHFKKVNDEHGHAAGDAVLRVVAAAVAAQLRTEDVLARFGGEEFAVMIRGDLRDGANLAERLRRVVATSTIVTNGTELAVTISAGCASVGCVRSPTAASLIAEADRLLYVAKREGRNLVVWMNGAGA